MSLTNVQVLWVSTVLFSLFVLAEVAAAYSSNSLALLGDAAAMSIDVFTVSFAVVCYICAANHLIFVCSFNFYWTLHIQYGCNLFSETRKATGLPMTLRMKFVTEVGLPLFSVSALVAVTIYITFDAIMILLAKKSAAHVDTTLMYIFASINFIVDAICTAMFHVRGKEIFHSAEQAPMASLSDSPEKPNGEQPSRLKKNLNMISAFFHIGGDTLRTIAIFLAALAASITNKSSSYCDAWAAIVVSITVLFLAVPMLFEIFNHMMPYLSNKIDGGQGCLGDVQFSVLRNDSSHGAGDHSELGRV